MKTALSMLPGKGNLPHGFFAEYHWYSWFWRCGRRLIVLSFVCSALPVLAIGLGGPVTRPVLMQPLRIEIPVLLGAEEPLPRADCVRIAPPHDGSDMQFFPKQVRLTLDNSPLPRLTISSPLAVREPFLEFRIILGCNGEISRDYLLLTQPQEAIDDLTASTATAAPAVPPEVSARPLLPSAKTQVPSASLMHGLTPQSQKSEVAIAEPNPDQTQTAKNQLKLRRDSTLNALARMRYPENLATRDEYRRLMSLANPALFGDASQVGSVPLPAGTVLTIPPNLPPPERVSGASLASAPVASAPITANPNRLAKAAPGGKAPPAASRDRLIIGGANENSAARPLSAKEAAATIERLDQMLSAQAASEQEIAEKLKSLESLFAGTKSQLQFLEAKSKQQEADQRQLQAKLDALPEPKSLGFAELLALIVSVGAVGAALLAFSHRQQMQRYPYSSVAIPDQSHSTLEPHPIFVAAPTSEVELDDDTVPLSKSFAPPAGVAPMTRQSTVSQPSSASRNRQGRGSTKTPTTSTKLVVEDAGPLNQQQEKISALGPAAAGSAIRRPINNTDNFSRQVDPAPATAGPLGRQSPESPAAVEQPNARSSEAQEIEFKSVRSTLPDAGESGVERSRDVAESQPEISFSLDLGALSAPQRPARVSSDIDFAEPNLVADSPHTDRLISSISPIAFDLTPRTHAEIEVALAFERDLAKKAPSQIAKPESSESAEDPAVELADIMISMGLEKDAERTLIDYILEDPKRDLGPWLKALEIYRESGRREDFEKLAISLRMNLNVAPDPWDFEKSATTPSLEGFSRVRETIQRLWPTEAADAYLGSLLGDNRDGSRAGFPQAVAEEILWLLRILRVRRETA